MNDEDKKIAESIRQNSLLKHSLSVSSLFTKIGKAIHLSALEAMEEYANHKCKLKDLYIKELQKECELANELIKELKKNGSKNS